MPGPGRPRKRKVIRDSDGQFSQGFATRATEVPGEAAEPAHSNDTTLHLCWDIGAKNDSGSIRAQKDDFFFPIYNPIFVGSDRIAGTPDVDMINNMRGGSTEIRVMVLPRSTQVFILLIPYVESFTWDTLNRRGRGGIDQAMSPPRHSGTMAFTLDIGTFKFSSFRSDDRYHFRVIGLSDTISNTVRLASPPRRKPGIFITKGANEKYALIFRVTSGSTPPSR